VTIEINPMLEARLRERAEAQQLTVAAYIERLILADQSGEDELESIALEGLNSGRFNSNGI